MRKYETKSDGFDTRLSHFKLFTLTFFTLLFSGIVFSQQVYTTTVVSEDHVTNSGNSIDSDVNTYSELTSSGGVALGLGGYNSHLELSFPAVVPANQTTFVRIETQDDLLTSLLGGTIGGLLSDVVGVALIGNQEFDVDVKNGANTVLSGSSTNPISFSGERLKIVLDADGHTYIALTPNQPYQSIRITNRIGSLIGLGVTKKMKVWDPYYSTQNTNCFSAQFTSYDAVGLSLELLNLGGGVTNLNYAIDGDMSSYSVLSLGVVSVAGSITQRAYFEGPSHPTDSYGIRFSIDPALLAITLGEGIDIKANLGANEVMSVSLESILTPANLLDLQNGNATNVYIQPNQATDRIIVDFNGLLDIVIDQKLNIHEIFRVPALPDLDLVSSDTIICEGTTSTLTVDAANPNNEIRWYDSPTATTPFTVTASGATYTTGALYNDTTLYVTAAEPGCPDNSVKVPIDIKIIPAPLPTDLSVISSPSYCQVDSVIVIANSLSGDSFNWYTDPSGAPISTGSAGGIDFIEDNDTLIIIGLTTNGSPFSVFTSFQDSVTGCWLLMDDFIETPIIIEDEPAPTTNSALQTFCASEMATVSDLQVNENVAWYDAPTGGGLVDASDMLNDGDVYYASTIGANCESSERLEITVQIEDESAPTTDEAVQTFCASEGATVTDLQVNENVAWYDAPTGGELVDGSEVLSDGDVYYASTVGANCESSERLEITIQIEDEPAPTTDEAVQTFCASEMATVSDLQVNENVAWYDAPTGGVLVDGSEVLSDGDVYYASTVGANCESSERLEITVQIEDESAPTTDEAVQTFCASEMATVSDLQVNENVAWYDAPTGGELVDGSEVLSDGDVYYASTVGANCESSERLEITIQIEDEPAPTTDEAVQTFCASELATVSDLQVNGNVAWYDAPTGGELVDGSEVLSDGDVYYASTVGANCESSERLEITVQIEDEPAPTTDNAVQEFCSNDLATIADLQVNGTSVNWYNADGEPLNDTTLLEAGEYWATTQGDNCESSDSLLVTVTFIDMSSPTTEDSVQIFCTSNEPTVGDIQVNEGGTIVWFDALNNELDPSSPLSDSTYYYAAFSNGTCMSEDLLEVLVIFEDQYDISLEGFFEDLCLYEEFEYTVDAGMSDYTWEITGGTVVSGGGSGDDFIVVSWEDTTNTTIFVSYISEGGCLIQTEEAISVSTIACANLVIDKTVDNDNPLVDDEIVFTITVLNDGQVDAYDVVISEVIQSGFTYVSHEASSGTYSPFDGEWEIPLVEGGETETLTITVKVNSAGEYFNVAVISSIGGDEVDFDNSAEVIIYPICLSVYNEISPNGDGVNDVLIIDCIEQYPNNSLTIFNRYGNLVYETTGYENDWGGYANVSGVFRSGEQLPTGTYYYLLKVDEVSLEKTGWIYIVK